MSETNFPEVYIGWIPVRDPVDRTGRYSFLHEFGVTQARAVKHVTDGPDSFERDNPVVKYERVRVTVESIEEGGA